MNIGIFGESFLPIYDGVGRVMQAYADVLTSHGHKVYVITPQYETGYKGGLPYEIIDYTAFRLYKGLPYKVGFPRLDIHFRHAIKHLDLDIIHLHGPFFASRFGMRIAKKKKIPCVATFHTKFDEDVYAITKNRLYAKITAKYVGSFFNKCTEAWAVSDGCAGTLRGYGCKKNIRVMPNGTEKRVLNESLISQVSEKYGIRHDCPVLLFVGRLNWNKNILRILESVKILKESCIDYQLIIVGKGPHEREISKSITKMGLSDCVKMIGFIFDREVLDCVYSLSDLFVFPSIYDTSSLVVRESAMMKVPSLVVEGTCSAEVIDNMKNGIACQDTSESVADGIKKYLSMSDDEKQNMKQCAFETIPVDWETLVSQAEDIYKELIEQNKILKKKKKD